MRQSGGQVDGVDTDFTEELGCPGKFMAMNTVPRVCNMQEVGHPGFNALLSGNLSL